MTTETISKEELDQLNKDLASSANVIAQKMAQESIEKAKDEGRKEAQAEFELKQKLAEQEKLTKQLQEQIEAQKKAAQTEAESMKKKLEELTASKATIPIQNPFANSGGAQPTQASHIVDTWDDEKLDQVEQESARAFFGESYDQATKF